MYNRTNGVGGGTSVSKGGGKEDGKDRVDKVSYGGWMRNND